MNPFLKLAVSVAFVCWVGPLDSAFAIQNDIVAKPDLRTTVTAEIQHLLDELVAEGKSPAAFAAVGGNGIESVILCSGKRRAGKNDPVTPDDVVHIGSCTKAMTAAMIARLVEQGKLNWDDTIEMRLPEVAKKIDATWRGKTLVQLLSHTAGVVANPLSWHAGTAESVSEKRKEIIEFTLKDARTGEIPKWEYSNFGVMIAGQMASETMGCSWEELITKELFEPLQMLTAGFGPPGDRKKRDQPWGHSVSEKGDFYSLYLDNAPALGPAGTVHLSIADWLKFTRIFYEMDNGNFLSADSRRKLIRPVAESYALGWTVLKRPWGNGTVLTHNGSNTRWFALCWLAPKTGRTYLVVMNNGQEEMALLADGVVAQLISIEREFESGLSK